MCVLVAQSCPTLCDPVDCSPLGSFVRGILQARILEWVANSFSSAIILLWGKSKWINTLEEHLGNASIILDWQSFCNFDWNSKSRERNGRKSKSLNVWRCSVRRLGWEAGALVFYWVKSSNFSPDGGRVGILALPTKIKNMYILLRSSLVVQWLRIRLAMQGMWVDPWLGNLRSQTLWSN